ncbi:MAG: DUF2752 domain-containing protein [Agathobacter sp.]|nr:DUF2752 domain-containing protein [Lachnobacterium sp.]MDY6155938.1 DUF2752 domain-containing protein [Agathobacter sp.]
MQDNKILCSKRTQAVAATAAVVVLYVVLENLGITCPIKFFTGISCAGCGMSRAWLSVLRLDMAGAFRYHPLFFLPPVVLVVILLKSKINIKVYKIFMFTIVAAFVIVYMYRMIWGEGDIVVFKPKDSIIWRIIKSL